MYSSCTGHKCPPFSSYTTHCIGGSISTTIKVFSKRGHYSHRMNTSTTPLWCTPNMTLCTHTIRLAGWIRVSFHPTHSHLSILERDLSDQWNTVAVTPVVKLLHRHEVSLIHLHISLATGMGQRSKVRGKPLYTPNKGIHMLHYTQTYLYTPVVYDSLLAFPKRTDGSSESISYTVYTQRSYPTEYRDHFWIPRDTRTHYWETTSNST